MSTLLIIVLMLWIILICIYIIYKYYYSHVVGWFGEFWTKCELKKLPKDKYKVLNNILIISSDGTHQIDHVVISQYGVFVIETKQYNGYLTGSKYDKKWIRHFGKKHMPYTNPITQNYGHILALSKLLELDKTKIYNIVCIPSKAKLKVEHDGELVRNYNLVNKILSYKYDIIFNTDELVNTIKKNNIIDKHIRKEHINSIKRIKFNDDLSKCPKCGSLLVERNSKYGLFYGCSNYPKCNYTRNK